MEPRILAQLEAEKTYTHFISCAKRALYWIVAVLINFAFFSFRAVGTGNQYSGEVHTPMNVGWAMNKMPAQKSQNKMFVTIR